MEIILPNDDSVAFMRGLYRQMAQQDDNLYREEILFRIFICLFLILVVMLMIGGCK